MKYPRLFILILTASSLLAHAQGTGERMVQIHGKWYKYRSDNRYVIDGVTTYHVPKKIFESPASAEPGEDPQPKAPLPTAPPRATAAAPVPASDSQNFMNLPSGNPLNVYTPSGFQEMQKNLEELKRTAAERNRILEELSKEP